MSNYRDGIEKTNTEFMNVVGQLDDTQKAKILFSINVKTLINKFKYGIITPDEFKRQLTDLN